MKNRIKKYLKEIIVFILILLVATNVMSYFNSQNLNKEKLSINNFTLLNDKEYLVLEDKPLIIHFWATWCPTCKFEASNIEKLSKDYEVITIAVQSGTKEEIEKYLKEHNLTFNVVNDEEAIYSRNFNIKAFPTTFIYDENKNLRFSEVGYTSTFGLYFRMKFVEYFKK
jgi:thiol-disulfide isomerase/thioredoxin